jgi:hypothetical protein
MVCPNCQSNDVITVQDQLFCVNCGRRLTKAEAAVHQKAPKSTKQPVKRSVGRPRVAKLDTPLTPKAIAEDRTPTRLVSDIDVVKRIPSKTVVPGCVAHHSVVIASLQALRPLWIVLALPGATILASAMSLGTLALLYTTKVQQEQQLAVSLCLALAGFIWLRYIRSAVMFYRAGVHDHRLMGIKTALRTVAARTGQLCSFGLRHSAAALAELTILAVIVWYGGGVTQLPLIAHLGLLFLAIFGLLYLLSSLWVVQRLVEAAIVISNLNLPTAHWLGWKLWRRHWELLGARFGALLVVLTLGGGVAIGLRTGLEHLAPATQLGLWILAGSIAVAVLTVSSGGAAEATYRQLILSSHSQRAGQLLGRRRALQPSNGALLLLASGLVLPLLATALIVVLWR